jgi:PBP superfamily domain
MFGFARAQQTAPASQIRRLYVEPFATQAGSEKFREDVISQLRKLNSVSVAADESSADAILGGGEVWIKGYRSHNPQLGKGAPNGTPIYAGFLSIALRDKNGQTLWSYLATLPRGVGRCIERSFDADCKEASRSPETMRSAFANSRRGSACGEPLRIAQRPRMHSGSTGRYLSGKDQEMECPILTRANRGVRLPDLDIAVVHRADGSGTSYVWTDCLSNISPEWKAQVGTSLAPKWPVGLEADGNDGVSKLVKEHAGSIGYVEFIYALQNHLTYGRVRNRDGKFVSASLESIAVAASRSMKVSRDFKVSIVDAPGADAYPISSFTWIVVPLRSANDATRNALTGFLQWMLGPGHRQAAALGYLPLPKDVAIKEEAAIARIH